MATRGREQPPALHVAHASAFTVPTPRGRDLMVAVRRGSVKLSMTNERLHWDEQVLTGIPYGRVPSLSRQNCCFIAESNHCKALKRRRPLASAVASPITMVSISQRRHHSALFSNSETSFSHVLDKIRDIALYASSARQDVSPREAGQDQVVAEAPKSTADSCRVERDRRYLTQPEQRTDTHRIFRCTA